jgi:hypothetical protein
MQQAIVMEKNNVFKALDDLVYVYEAGKMNVLGHRFINNSEFEKSLELTKERLSEQMQKAVEIKEKEQSILTNAEEKATELFRETEEYIDQMDAVKEANKKAEAILEQAELKAAKIVEEANEIRDKTIEYGETVKSKLINQGLVYVEGNLQSLLETIDKSTSHFSVVRDELTKAHFEIQSTVDRSEEEDDDEELYREKRNA